MFEVRAGETKTNQTKTKTKHHETNLEELQNMELKAQRKVNRYVTHLIWELKGGY